MEKTTSLVDGKIYRVSVLKYLDISQPPAILGQIQNQGIRSFVGNAFLVPKFDTMDIEMIYEDDGKPERQQMVGRSVLLEPSMNLHPVTGEALPVWWLNNTNEVHVLTLMSCVPSKKAPMFQRLE